MKTRIISMLAALAAFVACGGNGAGEVNPDSFCTQGGTSVSFTALGHGSLMMTIGEENLYFDPVIAMLPDSGDFTAYPKADYIFVTHSHPDHLDTLAIAQLSKEGTVLVANAESAARLGTASVMAPGDTLDFGAFGVAAVPAYNCSEGKQMFHPQGRDNGYVVEVDGFRTYVAGDTEDIPELAALSGMDVAFLPCNLPFTMTPEQLANAAKMVMPKVLYPYHYGQTDIQQVCSLLEGSGIDVRIREYR